MIRLGMCADPINSTLIAEQGYDYLECNLTHLATMEEEAYLHLREEVLSSGIRCEAGNSLLPAACRLTGENADHNAALIHVAKFLPRFAQLGGQIAVFGAGGARAVPSGWPGDKAMEQLAAFTRRLCDLCADFNVRVAIEPLNRGECNIINSVEDGLELARLTDHSRAGVLADWYHVMMESETPGGILAAGKMLWHCHIARKEGRAYPRPDDPQDAGYAVFFSALKKINYDSRVSVEGRGDLLKDGPAALTTLRRFI